MKIRLRGNSIRYRLDKNDVELLKATNKVESSTHIGAGILHFCIKRKEISDPVIKLEADGVHLFLPEEQIDNWLLPEQVGFEIIIPNTDGTEVKILVEKDFKCLNTRDEDDSQSFDHPNSGQNC
ncbi:hypothetical protein DVR12_12510 [Chitinophaga silvatica]|uniref:Uncharacterized protein n=1 Tax=Chitinophaga silvatica TaxID=2282649 RepID=A0A3E1YAA0_9BACT|nr:hypothetical protein [Chitinophaga silvatica]RFS22615.1 hypothetical protein DVR12_12510 [Chitinophaga silvatica]